MNKKEIDKYQKDIINKSGISKETWEFLNTSKAFLEKNNIKSKKFGYQSGLSFSTKE